MTNEQRTQLLRMRLKDLSLNIGTLRRLELAGIVTLRDLVRKTKPDLLAIHNIGKRAVADIEDLVLNLGLRLGMSEEETPMLSDERKRMLWECYMDIANEAAKEYQRERKDGGGEVVPLAGMCAFYTVRTFEEFIRRVEKAYETHTDLFDHKLYGFDALKDMLFPELGEDENDENGN